MKIQEIDKNFLQNAEYDREKVTLYDVTEAPFSLHGIFYDRARGKFLRMPQDRAMRVSDGVGYLVQHTAGGRVRFSTDSKTLTLIVEYDGLEIMSHMAISGCCGFALCENGEEEVLVRGIYPLYTEQEGFVRKVELVGEGMRDYTLHFPLYQGIKKVYIGLENGARVGAGKAYEKNASRRVLRLLDYAGRLCKPRGYRLSGVYL